MTATAAASQHRTSPGAAPGSFTHRQIVTILLGLMLGVLLAALDQTIVSTAIRTIADDDLQAGVYTVIASGYPPVATEVQVGLGASTDAVITLGHPTSANGDQHGRY